MYVLKILPTADNSVFSFDQIWSLIKTGVFQIFAISSFKQYLEWKISKILLISHKLCGTIDYDGDWKTLWADNHKMLLKNMENLMSLVYYILFRFKYYIQSSIRDQHQIFGWEDFIDSHINN